MRFATRMTSLMLMLAAVTTMSASAHAAGGVGAITGYQQGRWVVSGSLGMGLANTYGGNGSPLIAASA